MNNAIISATLEFLVSELITIIQLDTYIYIYIYLIYTHIYIYIYTYTHIYNIYIHYTLPTAAMGGVIIL